MAHIPLSHFVNVNSVDISDTFTLNRLNALVMSAPETPQPLFTEYLSLLSVGEAYGLQSDEYKFAKVFFSYVSKTATVPERLTFYNWDRSGAKAALKGARIADLDSIKLSGGFVINIDGTEETITVDLSDVTSFTEAAGAINTALNNKALCEYNTTSGGFILSANTCGAEHSIGYAETGAGTDLSSVLGLSEGAGAVIIDGKSAMTLEEALQEIEIYNGNYVSVSSLVPLNPETDFKTISEWTKASEGRYLFVANEDDTNLKTLSVKYENLFGNDGFIANYSGSYKMNAFTQAAIAAVDFSSLNGAMNFNFIEADSFSSEAIDTAEALENLNRQKFNCVYRTGGYGQSQVLYGEGSIFGSTFSDISGYIGNTWLKAQIEIYGVNALISIPNIPLRGQGSAVIRSAVQTPIDMAKRGGIISAVGIGNLTNLETSAILAATGDTSAADLIEQTGYYLAAEPLTADDIANKRIRLLLIYTRNIPVNRVVIRNYVLGA